MEALKQVLAVLGAVVGVLTGLLTLYAKYLDVRKAVQEEKTAGEATASVAPEVLVATGRPAELRPMPETYADAPLDPGSRARALQVVKAPALALIIAGWLSLLANVGFAGFGYVDEFVTPLSSETKLRKAVEAARINDPEAGLVQPALAVEGPERSNTILAIITLLSFSVPSAMALWGGFEMLRLRSYWVSVAGSVAIMPGACVCCLAGFPIGVWSLTILFRPEIAASFH